MNPNTPKKVEKTIAVNVLDEKPIKIAIRAVLINLVDVVDHLPRASGPADGRPGLRIPGDVFGA